MILELISSIFWYIVWNIMYSIFSVIWTGFSWMNSILAAVVMPFFWGILCLNIFFWFWTRREELSTMFGRKLKFGLGAPYTPQSMLYGAAGPRPPFVVITGGARGLGQQLVQKFVKLNYEVEVWDIAVEDQLPESALKNRKVVYNYVNVADGHSIKKACDALIKKQRIPDLLILNAGIVTGKRIGEMSMERTELLFQVNVLQHFHVLNSLMLPMVGLQEAGGPLFPKPDGEHTPCWSRGIVVVGSVAGFAGCAYVSDYSCSKAASNLFAEALAAEIRLANGPRDVQVTLAAPYRINTGMFDGTQDLTLLQLLKEEDVADEILRGIQLKKDYVILPYWLMIMHMIRAIIPARCTPHLDRFFGASEGVKNLGAAVDAREEKVKIFKHLQKHSKKGKSKKHDDDSEKEENDDEEEAKLRELLLLPKTPRPKPKKGSKEAEEAMFPKWIWGLLAFFFFVPLTGIMGWVVMRGYQGAQ